MEKDYLKLGSQGDLVSKLQRELNLKGGYGLKEDGILGEKTTAAIKDYQSKQGLDIDGIVGPQTWALLMNGYDNPFETTSTPSSPSNSGATNNGASNGGSANKGFTYNDFSYDDYVESDTVKQAGEALNAYLSQKPGEYQSQWQGQIDETLGKILNREDFSYDFNGDALYQQYKDKYIQQGKMAMQDTMGQAAAMTGGYGNSYAQSVGQQAYNAQLENLNDIIPELYQMALDKYQMEGQDLYNQYAMLGDREALDYGRYRDSLGDWQTERDYLTGRYDSERDYDYGKYVSERDFAYGQYGDDKAYAYQDYRDAIADEQYREQMDFQKQQYEDSKKVYSSGGSSSGGSSGGGSSNGSSGGTGYNNGSLTSSQIKELQNALGVSADGKYGPDSKKAAGGLSAEEAYKKYVGNGNGGYKAVNTQGVQNFKAGIRTKNEFYGRQSAEKEKYKTYDAYIEGKLDEWMQKGMLTEDEVATLIAYYGL